MRYSIEQIRRQYVKVYEILSFTRFLTDKYGEN